MGNSPNISGNILTPKQKASNSDALEVFDFDVIGMDCTSCAKSIKTYLDKLDGITNAEINYASESGEVTYEPDIISREVIKKSIKSLGYDVSSEDEEYEAEQMKKQNLKRQKIKIITSVALSLIIMGMSMKDHIPVLNVLNIPNNVSLIILFVFSTIVIFWCGDKFLKGAYTSLRNRTSDMNTLISLGSLSSYIYSIIISVNIIFDLGISALADSKEVYYETAAMIITFLLIGNYLEALLKSRTQTSIKKLKELLDIHAITQEEFEKKKNQLLNNL